MPRVVVAALEEDVRHRMSPVEAGRVELQGTGREPVGVVEPAAFLGDHRLEPQQQRVLTHGRARRAAHAQGLLQTRPPRWT